MTAPVLPTPLSSLFGALQIAYAGDLLRPRAWTIEQARWAIELHPDTPAGAVLELCSGAGQIGLVVGVETRRPLVQVDVHDGACWYATLNAANADVVSDVRRACVTSALSEDERFPMILADPPYVPTDEIGTYPDDPPLAIDGGRDGLELARLCLDVASAHLAPEGVLLLQLGGLHQVEALREHAHGQGLRCIETREFGVDRAVLLLRRESTTV